MKDKLRYSEAIKLKVMGAERCKVEDSQGGRDGIRDCRDVGLQPPPPPREPGLQDACRVPRRVEGGGVSQPEKISRCAHGSRARRFAAPLRGRPLPRAAQRSKGGSPTLPSNNTTKERSANF